MFHFNIIFKNVILHHYATSTTTGSNQIEKTRYASMKHCLLRGMWYRSGMREVFAQRMLNISPTETDFAQEELKSARLCCEVQRAPNTEIVI